MLGPQCCYYGPDTSYLPTASAAAPRTGVLAVCLRTWYTASKQANKAGSQVLSVFVSPPEA